MRTDQLMPVIERFHLLIDEHQAQLDRLDRNTWPLNGDGDAGRRLLDALGRALPADSFEDFAASFGQVCQGSLSRAFQGGLWPAIADLWLPYPEIDPTAFVAAFESAGRRATSQYPSPRLTGTVLEAFQTVAGMPASTGCTSCLVLEATTAVGRLALRSQDPGVRTVELLLGAVRSEIACCRCAA